MTVENVSKVSTAARGSKLMGRVETGIMASPFAAYLQDVEVAAMLKAAPLTARGGELGFVHKTVQEYLAASGLVASLERAFAGTSLAEIEKLLGELLPAEAKAKEPAARIGELADSSASGDGVPLLKSVKARPLARLLSALAASPLSQLRLAREEGDSVIEEQVLDFLVDAALADARFVSWLGLLRRLVCAVDLHGGMLEQAGSNLHTLLTARLAKRAHGWLLHEAAREGNMALLRLALDACAEDTGERARDKEADTTVEARDDRGRTPLFVAAVAGNAEAVNLLASGSGVGTRADLVAELSMVKNKVGSAGNEHGARANGLVATGCMPKGPIAGLNVFMAVGVWSAGLTSAAVQDGCWRFEVEILEPPNEKGPDGKDTELSVGWSSDDKIVDAFANHGAVCRAMESGVLLGRDARSVGFERQGTTFHATPRPSYDKRGKGEVHAQLPAWHRGDVVGVAIDMQRQVALFALNQGEWAEVPLPKEKRFFPAVSGCFSGGRLELSIGGRGENGWRTRSPPGEQSFRPIKDSATGNAPALAAAAAGHTAIALTLLQRGSANMWKDSEREHRWTPMHAAARWNDKELMQAALDHAPDSLNARDVEGLVPVELAAKWQQKDVLEALLLHETEGAFEGLPLAELMGGEQTVLNLSQRSSPLGPHATQLLSGILLVHGQQLRQLDLSKQPIGVDGVAALSKVLPRSCTSLEVLMLGCTQMGASGGVVLARCLAAMTSVTSVCAFGNSRSSGG